METLLWLLLLVALCGALAWYRVSLVTATAAATGYVALYTLFGDSGWLALLGWLLLAAIAVP